MKKNVYTDFYFLKFFTAALLCLFLGIESHAQQSSAPCNQYSPWTDNTYGNLAAVSSTTLGLDNWSDKQRIIDSNLNNFSSWTAVLGGSAWIEARNDDATGAEVFPAGSYAGFVVDDLNLLALGASMRITTYLDGTERESVLYTDLITTLLDANGRRRIGFVTTQSFNRVRLTVNAGLSVLFTANAYHAEILKACAGPLPGCNQSVAMVRTDYGAVIEPSRTGLSGVGLGSIADADNVANADTSDFATISLNAGLLASASISARNLADTFPSGYFAGFEISNATLVGLGLLENVTISTYLDGALRESRSANQLLLSAPILSSSGRQTAGFATTLSFDEIRLTISQPLGVTLGSTLVYHPVIKRYCEGPELVCNVQTSVTEPSFPINIAADLTGITGAACVGCSISNLNHVIDSDASNAAAITLTAGTVVSGSVAVLSALGDYPAGTFAGFEYQNPVLAGTDILEYVQIRTYLNGVLQESSSNLTLTALNSSLLNGTGRQIAGFITTQPFDAIRFTVNQGVALDLGTTLVYRAVLQKMCAGPALTCNVLTNMVLPEYPVYVNSTRTGIFGLAGVGNSVNNTNHLINADLGDHADIVLLAGVAAAGSISVADAVTDYPSGTFVGYDIENTTLLDAEILNAITIQTYLNGVLQETKSGLGSLISVGSSLLTDDGRRIVGFVSSQPFDEARISIVNLVSADVGTTKVYRLVTKRLCAANLVCGQTYFLSEPQFPVVINEDLTGIQGVVSVGSSVQNASHVISSSNTDFGTIQIAAGVLNQGSISVLDPVSTYPTGSVAGFAIQDVNNLLQADLFESITICTRLNGVVQECKSGGELIDLAALVIWIGDGPGVYNVGFTTTKPFDEITISVGSLASVLNVIRVYSAFVDTRSASGDGFNCPGTISGTVLADTDGDGIGDVPQSGVTLSLYDQNDVLVAVVVSGIDGTYTFSNIVPGSYKVVLTVPNGFTAIDDTDGGNLAVIGDVETVVLTAGATVDALNFTTQPTTLITGTVFNDANRLADNTVNGTGTNAGGIHINLVNPVGDIVLASIPVNADGTYLLASNEGVQINSSYRLILSTNLVTIGSTLASSTLPVPWFSTGENLGVSAGSDGTVDGILGVSTTVGALTEANFGIVQAPDVTPVITAQPNVMNGPTDFNIRVQVVELHQVNTDGTITVRIPKDTRWTLREPYDSGLTLLDGISMENNKWAFSENATQYIFTTVNPSIVIPGGGFSTFGIKARWSTVAQEGIYTITSQIDSLRGKEIPINNNSDAEKIDFFNN